MNLRKDKNPEQPDIIIEMLKIPENRIEGIEDLCASKIPDFVTTNNFAIAIQPNPNAFVITAIDRANSLVQINGVDEWIKWIDLAKILRVYAGLQINNSSMSNSQNTAIH